jgi:hypothetical protein
MKSGCNIVCCYYCVLWVPRGWGRTSAHKMLWLRTFLPIVLSGRAAISYVVTYSQIEMAAVIFRDVFNDVTAVPCCPKLILSCMGLVATIPPSTSHPFPNISYCLSWILTMPTYSEAIATVPPSTLHPFPNISYSAFPSVLPQLKPNGANVLWGDCQSPSFYLTSLPKYQRQCLLGGTASVET